MVGERHSRDEVQLCSLLKRVTVLFGNEVSLSLSLGLFNRVNLNSVAYCEVNLMISALFRPGGPDFDLYETDESDVMPVHDLIVPLPKLDTKGVRVIFH
jgi:hypothetical protein